MANAFSQFRSEKHFSRRAIFASIALPQGKCTCELARNAVTEKQVRKGERKSVLAAPDARGLLLLPLKLRLGLLLLPLKLRPVGLGAELLHQDLENVRFLLARWAGYF